MKLIYKIIFTQTGFGVSLMRIVVGGIFFKAGAGKLFGWFGGYGLDAVFTYFQNLGIPFPVFNGYLVAITEFAGGLALILGFATRLTAFPFCIIMLIAIITADKDDPYYPLVLLMSSIALIDAGGGLFSLDKLLSRFKIFKKCL
ncbi:MAG: DoxX family protein [Deltaproteobacteria bacterium CG11_big_fil_rev_8_21_14_0_20_49_13]|nr:MAG: DoxX family protein [Deltaproteobacteria bacterium CG11_big_fil_rev_8_21_14_0_20_49_13]